MLLLLSVARCSQERERENREKEREGKRGKEREGGSDNKKTFLLSPILDSIGLRGTLVVSHI